jgi:ATP-dependent DNA helicase RecG
VEARPLRTLADTPITAVSGIGPERAKALEQAFGITTVLDLLTHYPRRHLDKTKQASIRDARVDEQLWVFGRVVASTSVPGRGRGRARTQLRITDGSGYMTITFFNQAWRARQFPEGSEALFFGKVTVFRGAKQMANPEIDLLDEEDRLQIAAVYPQSDKLKIYSRDFRRWLRESLRRAGELVDPLPAALLDRYGFIDRSAAFRGQHAPESMVEVEASRRRLVFDELLRIQLALVMRKRRLESTSQGIAHGVGDGGLVERFWGRLPFDLTGDQRRVIDEISADLARPSPMHRLLQGDVGSGKTVVAVSALLVAVQGGHQGAFMAPTEVLAEQHHTGIRSLLDGIEVGDDASLFGHRPLKVELLTNRVSGKERERILGELASGGVDLVVGTHALIQEGVGFRSLGVVVIDEQHRFGVEQRAALREKAGGVVPDVLVMTATPIPRTAAMTVYGDLDVSVLKEKPAGRQPIVTSWRRGPLEEAEVWARVRTEVAAGRQAYVVCPLIEESDKLQARSAQETYERLEADELSGLRLGLLHGRLPAAEKEATMHHFRERRLDVLVATTVIEVGVDVPNATVMVILDADRFGIAQLHQLRGRVGRGADASYCFLVSEDAAGAGNERLEAMERTEDGFELAEIDLELRGEGTVFGERQKGRSDLKLASLRRDKIWVQRAREGAVEVVDTDPFLDEHPDLQEELRLFLDEEDEAFLFKS